FGAGARRRLLALLLILRKGKSWRGNGSTVVFSAGPLILFGRRRTSHDEARHRPNSAKSGRALTRHFSPYRGKLSRPRGAARFAQSSPPSADQPFARHGAEWDERAGAARAHLFAACLGRAAADAAGVALL